MNPYRKVLSSLPRLRELNYCGTVVSLFSGGGGLDLGLAFAGFRTCYAGDIEQHHCNTIEHNFADCYTEAKDVRDLTGAEILSKAGVSYVDLLAGGPPCQAFSILGQRNSFSDPRGQLVYEYARIIAELHPSAFVFENVPGLLTVNRGADWRNLLDFFKATTKYHLFTQVLNAADYGVPQIRKRVFIVGFRDSGRLFKFPSPTHYDYAAQRSLFGMEKPWIPAKWALEGLRGTPNHRIRIHGNRVRSRYNAIPPGGRDRADHTDRIHPDRPSGTVLVGSKAGGGRPFIHPYKPRHISVREAARLQSFPDWYEFKSADTWQYRAVGNAVPPLLARAVGVAIAAALRLGKFVVA